MILGDARVTLARASEAKLDLLVLDAFSSDSIPLHLLTVEAFQLYSRAILETGVIAFHITNRHVDVYPPLLAAPEATGFVSRIRREREPPAGPGTSASDWVALARNPSVLASLPAVWLSPGSFRRPKPWTDDHSNVVPALRRDIPSTRCRRSNWARFAEADGRSPGRLHGHG